MLLAYKLILLRLRGGLLSRLAGTRCGLPGLLWQQNGLDIGQNTTLGDGHAAEEFVQLLVITYSQLEMARNDTGLLVVSCGVASQLQNLSGQILQDGSQVDRGPSTDSLCVITFAEETMDTTNGKLQAGTGASSLGLGADLSSFASSRHFDSCHAYSLQDPLQLQKIGEKDPQDLDIKATVSPALQDDRLRAKKMVLIG